MWCGLRSCRAQSRVKDHLGTQAILPSKDLQPIMISLDDSVLLTGPTPIEENFMLLHTLALSLVGRMDFLTFSNWSPYWSFFLLLSFTPQPYQHPRIPLHQNQLPVQQATVFFLQFFPFSFGTLCSAHQAVIWKLHWWPVSRRMWSLPRSWMSSATFFSQRQLRGTRFNLPSWL